MKSQIILSIAFSVLAANAFANDTNPITHTHAAPSHVTTQYDTNRVAQDGSDRTLNRVVQNDSDRTLNRVAQDGSDYVLASHV